MSDLKNSLRVVLSVVVAACWLARVPVAAGGNLETTQKLISVLRSNAGLLEKARACEQLGEVGTKEAVPPLAALLTDEHLAAYARTGLEGIPDLSAAAALREALPNVKGNLLLGVIHSLGALRDAKAVGALRKLAADPDSGIAGAALLALGHISNQESIAVLKQALSSSLPSSRESAAEACLLAAQRQLAEGHSSVARALYESVRTGKFSPSYRGAATGGAILARGTEAVPFLIKQLRSDDPAVRNAALLTIREIPGDRLANALNNELSRPRPGLEIPLLMALADCHNAQSLDVLQNKSAAQDPEVRQAALRSLGRIGGSSAAEILLKSLAEKRAPDESALAANGLARMESPEVDDLVVKSLSSARDSDLRIQLIRILENRGAGNAAPELLKETADSDPKVALAALNAIKNSAGISELPALMALNRTFKDGPLREAAESAISSACAQSDASQGSEVVLAAFKQASDPAEKNTWARILVSLGYAKALPDLEAAARDADTSVALNAVESLGRWPDPSPIESLLSIAETGNNPIQRQRALASAVQLAWTASDEHQRPDGVIIAWLERADKAGPAMADQHRIISALARLPQPESLHLLLPCLEEPELQTDAALAVVQIAPALLKTVDSSTLGNALEKIAATVQNKDIRDKAIKLAATIPGANHPSSLFDIRSLAGWEGDTNVWRVRDGVIVGGSMNGNPRNEFLATTRPYTNFILRLQYKLVGTEGFVNSGVQFHSVRLKDPPNEMSGFQADIGAGCSGSLYDESRRNKFVTRASDAQILRLEKPGEWNDYEVRCDGPRIRIKLNGEQTIDYTETDPSIPLSGYLGLQIHGGNKAEVSFRNIFIIESIESPSKQ